MFSTRRTPGLLRRIALTAAALVGVANLFHRVLFPSPTPDPNTFPREGDRFGSTAEGITQEVVAVRDGWLVLRSELAPGADGPPLHLHQGFAEVFHVESGTVHLELPSGVIQLGPGQTYRIEAGVPHRPFNPTSEPAVIAGTEPVMPQSFGASLVQIYPMLDEAGGKLTPSLLLHVFALDPIFDSHPPGVPKLVRAAVDWLVVPFARMFGYRNYYPERSLHPPAGRG